MVHALKEIWRVLDVDGCLLDLRPRVADRLFEVVIDGQGHEVAMLDNSLFIPDAGASDRAVAQMVEQGWFTLVEQDRFECKVYWNSLDEMLTYFDEQDKTTVVLTDEVIAKARQLSAQIQPAPKTRLTTTLGLDIYRKTVPSGE